MSRLSEEMRQRIVRNFMDLIIMKELRTSAGMSGYEATAVFNKKFRVLPSPGSVYSVLYAMEKKGLVESTAINGKKVYKLTRKGNTEVRQTLGDLNGILFFIKTILSEKSLL